MGSTGSFLVTKESCAELFGHAPGKNGVDDLRDARRQRKGEGGMKEREVVVGGKERTDDVGRTEDKVCEWKTLMPSADRHFLDSR